MKVRHKNSGEVFDLKEPVYTKLNGVYGYLTHACHFISIEPGLEDQVSTFTLDSEDISAQFDVIND
jgi:hypothetical protein